MHFFNTSSNLDGCQGKSKYIVQSYINLLQVLCQVLNISTICSHKTSCFLNCSELRVLLLLWAPHLVGDVACMPWSLLAAVAIGS